LEIYPMKIRSLLPLASVVLLASACATGGAARTSGDGGGSSAQADRTTSADGAPRVRRNPNMIVAEELRDVPHGNLFDVVSAMRPEWLRTSGTSVSGGGAIVVYVDGSRVGPPIALRQVPTSQARRLTYYSPTEAQARFGVGHSNGAIQVETGNR
jgi:hypothetical protein